MGVRSVDDKERSSLSHSGLFPQFRKGSPDVIGGLDESHDEVVRLDIIGNPGEQESLVAKES
jgi:hypothetical protein